MSGWVSELLCGEGSGILGSFGRGSFLSTVLEWCVLFVRRWCMDMLCNLLPSSFFLRAVELIFLVLGR